MMRENSFDSTCPRAASCASVKACLQRRQPRGVGLEAPVPLGQQRLVGGLLGLEQRLLLRPVLGAHHAGALEGHVLHHVGDAGLAHLLVRAAGVHHGLEREHRRVVALDDDELETVRERELLHLLLEVLEAGDHGRRRLGRDLGRGVRRGGAQRERDGHEQGQRQTGRGPGAGCESHASSFRGRGTTAREPRHYGTAGAGGGRRAGPAQRRRRRGPRPLHPGLDLRQVGEPVLAVQAVGVPRAQQDALDRGQVGARQDRLHEALRQSPAAMLLEDEDVAEPGERGVVRDQPGEADLPAGGREHREAQGVLDGAADRLPRPAGRPVGRAAQVAVDDVQVHAVPVVRDGVAGVLRRARVGGRVAPLGALRAHDLLQGETLPRAPGARPGGRR